jgi:hypothetical protein
MEMKLITIVISLSLLVILGTMTYCLSDLIVEVAVLRAEVEILKGEHEEQNTSELEPIEPDRGGDIL